MLRIYSVALHVVGDAGAAANAIGRHDPDLARQLWRASSSLLLNMAEGSGSTRGNRRQRYETARGSAYEVRACLDVGEKLGYVEPRTHEQRERMSHVIGVLHKLAR